MKSLLLATAAASALLLGAAQAQESNVPQPNTPAANGATDVDNTQTNATAPGADTGAFVGGATGAAAGAIVGGPVGAVIGGFAGAMIGSSAAVSQQSVDYVVANPVEPVVIQGGVSEGMILPAEAALTPIPNEPELAYVYVDGRPVIVQLESRKVVYSPGYVVPDQTVTYVRENPVDVIAVDGLAVGSVVPSDVRLVEVPSDPTYSYVYTSAGPVLVNNSSRTVVWVQ